MTTNNPASKTTKTKGATKTTVKKTTTKATTKTTAKKKPTKAKGKSSAAKLPSSVGKSLVIVESPAKARTVGQILGSKYMYQVLGTRLRDFIFAVVEFESTLLAKSSIEV